MAPRRNTGIKEFYAQKKNTPPVKSKDRTPATKRQIDTVPATYDDARPSTGTLGSDSAQPAALIAKGRRDYNDDIDNMEEVLRQFDMNMKYGPCIGVPRLERWERASKVGLDPPQQVKVFLERAGGISDCLWEGRV